MNTKVKIIIIGLITIALVGGMYRYISKKESANNAGEQFSLKDMFPFGTNTNTETQNNITDGTETIADGSAEIASEVVPEAQKLMMLYDQPVAGSGVTSSGTVRFAEKATAHILEWSPETKTSVKIANTTIPKIEDAFFNASGTGVILRYYNEQKNEIDTYGATITQNELIGNFFPYNISDIVASPDKTRVFYLYPSGGTTVGATSDFNGANRRQVFTSKFTSWLAGWANPQTVTATTKASAYFPGYLYQIKSTNGQFDRVVGGIMGMTALMSPDGTKALVSDSLMRLTLYDTAQDTHREMGFRTITEKCVWAANSIDFYCGIPTSLPAGTYPDDWYKGNVQFADELWRKNTATNITNRIAVPADSGYALDIIKLDLAPDNSFITFIDKTTLQLWVVML